MTITPSPNYEPTPRDDLIGEVMLLLDRAIEDDEEESTWSIAERIVDLIVPLPVDPPAAPTKGLNPALAALVEASRVKLAR